MNVAGTIERAATFIVVQVLQIFNAVTFLIGFVIVPISLFYVLNDEAKGRAVVNGWLHSVLRGDFWNVIHLMNTAVRAFLRGQVVLGLTVGLMIAIGICWVNA